MSFSFKRVTSVNKHRRSLNMNSIWKKPNFCYFTTKRFDMAVISLNRSRYRNSRFSCSQDRTGEKQTKFPNLKFNIFDDYLDQSWMDTTVCVSGNRYLKSMQHYEKTWKNSTLHAHQMSEIITEVDKCKILMLNVLIPRNWFFNKIEGKNRKTTKRII